MEEFIALLAKETGPSGMKIGIRAFYISMLSEDISVIRAMFVSAMAALSADHDRRTVEEVLDEIEKKYR